MFKKELDVALKELYIEDEPKTGTFYDFVLFINNRVKEQREERNEERMQRENANRYNYDYMSNLDSDTETSDSESDTD